jgi:hypothetical protein
MVADQRSAEAAEIILDGCTMAAIDEPSCTDGGYRHRRVQASAISPTSV